MVLAPGSNPDLGAQFANSQFYELALRTESRMSIIDKSTFYTGSTQEVNDSHAKNWTPLRKIILKQIDRENQLNTRCTYMVQYSYILSLNILPPKPGDRLPKGVVIRSVYSTLFGRRTPMLPLTRWSVTPYSDDAV